MEEARRRRAAEEGSRQVAADFDDRRMPSGRLFCRRADGDCRREFAVPHDVDLLTCAKNVDGSVAVVAGDRAAVSCPDEGEARFDPTWSMKHDIYVVPAARYHETTRGKQFRAVRQGEHVLLTTGHRENHLFGRRLPDRYGAGTKSPGGFVGNRIRTANNSRRSAPDVASEGHDASRGSGGKVLQDNTAASELERRAIFDNGATGGQKRVKPFGQTVAVGLIEVVEPQQIEAQVPVGVNDEPVAKIGYKIAVGVVDMEKLWFGFEYPLCVGLHDEALHHMGGALEVYPHEGKIIADRQLQGGRRDRATLGNTSRKGRTSCENSCRHKPNDD